MAWQSRRHSQRLQACWAAQEQLGYPILPLDCNGERGKGLLDQPSILITLMELHPQQKN